VDKETLIVNTVKLKYEQENFQEKFTKKFMLLTTGP